MADKHFQGYDNFESFMFSVVWTNDGPMQSDILNKAAGGWLEHKGDPDEIGRVVVEYVREHYTGNNPEAARETRFPDLTTDAEWDAVGRREVGEEVLELLKGEPAFAYLF